MQISVHMDISPKEVLVAIDGVDPETTVDVGVTAKEPIDKVEEVEEKKISVEEEIVPEKVSEAAAKESEENTEYVEKEPEKKKGNS